MRRERGSFTPKQQKAIEAFAMGGCSKAEALRTAGYKGKSVPAVSWRFFRRPDVIAAVEKLSQERREKTLLTALASDKFVADAMCAAAVLEKYTFTDAQTGQRFREFPDVIPDEDKGPLSHVVMTKRVARDGSEIIEYKAPEPVALAALAMKRLGLLVEKVENKNIDIVSILQQARRQASAKCEGK